MVIEHKKLPSPDYYRYASGNWDTPATRTPASTRPKKSEYDPAERFPGRKFPVTTRKIKKAEKKSGRSGHGCDAGRSSGYRQKD